MAAQGTPKLTVTSVTQEAGGTTLKWSDPREMEAVYLPRLATLTITGKGATTADIKATVNSIPVERGHGTRCWTARIGG